ncbi:MAG TPA: MFS transporter [Egibacteraceae bacterium]|nr:MFS transporter [Egibacteraceae bacterium]
MRRTDNDPRRTQRASFRLLYLGPFIAYGDRFAIAPILVSIARDLQESLAAVTAVAMFYFFLYGVMQPIYGVLADRFGRVRVMRFALVGMGLANLLSAAAGDLSALIVGKAAAAGFAAGILPLSLVYVGDKVPFDRRQQVIANVLAAGALGTVLATTGAGLLGRFSAWRAVFVIPAVLALALAVLLAWLPESLERREGTGPWGQITRVVTRPWALLLLGIAVAEGAFMLGMLTFLPAALEAHGESAAVAGTVVAVYGVAVFVGMQVLKRFIRRTAVEPGTLILAGGTLVTAAYLAAVPAQGIVNILLASLLIGFGYCFLHSTLQTWATEVVPEARGTAVTLFVTSVFTGAAIGTAAVRGLVDAQRFSAVFLVAAGLTVPVTLVGAWARRRYGETAAVLGAGGSP